MRAHRPPLAGWACGLLAGAAGGAVAATLDFVRGGPALATAGPRALGFLICLYGAVLALLGLGMGGLLMALRAFTVAGPLWRAAWTRAVGAGGSDAGRVAAEAGNAEAGGVAAAGRGEAGRAAEVGREGLVPWPAAVLALMLALLAFGAAVYGPTLTALLRFHHRTLIALLVGALGVGLVLPVTALGLLLLAGLTRILPGRGQARREADLPAADRRGAGRGIAVCWAGPPGLLALGWAVGLLLLGGAMTAAMAWLQAHPRMTPPLRALNLALVAPPILLVVMGLGHGLGRILGRLAPAGLRRLAERPAGWLVLPLGALALPVAVFALGYRDTLRLLDLRPLTALALALLGGALVVALRPPRGWRLVGLALLPLLWGGALLLGQGDRVRKAAMTHAALAAPLVQALHAAFDLDRDGHPSRWVVGGSDCDDLDPAVHPGAFDWPGDGIDQNCNGQDAQAQSAAVPPFPPLPPGLVARPNILLITVDALRADHIGAYGYGRPTTPNLDALAGAGVRFASAWAHAPSTRYSVPAILTGRYPSTLAWGPPAQHWPPEVLPENRLLAEMLHERGYHTTALLSYHYFEPTWGLPQGFDDYDVHLMTLHSLGGDPAATSGTSARELADLAIARLGQRAQEPARPFFLWVHFYDPHYRYEVHPEVPVFGGGRSDPDLYDGEVRFTDLHIGRVLEALRTTGLAQKTAVLLTADHGEGFGEHGIPPDRRHGYHLYADQTKVPLLLSLPGGPAGLVVHEPVGHVDLAPTIVQLAGGQAQQEPQLLGRSVLDLLTATPPRKGEVFQEVMYEGPTVRKALVAGPWHLIRNVIPDGTGELYNLADDPGEEHDLQGAPQVLGIEAGLSRRLSSWMDQSALPRDFAARVAGHHGPERPAVGQAVGARIGDLIEVVGADVQRPEVAPGSTAEVTLVLRVLRRPPAGWRLFTHLRGPSGFVNADHELLNGVLPLSQVRPGFYVRDEMKIPVPAGWAAGPATLDVGLFSGRERAAVTGPAALIDARDRVVHAARLVIR